MSSIRPILFVMLIVAGLAGPTASAEIFTWTDADGVVHISDRPPPEPSQIQDVLRYAPPPPQSSTPELPTSERIDSQQVERLQKQLNRLKERKLLLDKLIADNLVSIAEAEKELEHYRKRSGSFARRNEQTIQRQLLVLNNNRATHQSDLRYLLEDMAEVERQINAIEGMGQ